MYDIISNTCNLTDDYSWFFIKNCCNCLAPLADTAGLSEKGNRQLIQVRCRLPFPESQ